MILFSWIFIWFIHNKEKKKQFKNVNSHHSCPSASIATYRNAVKFILRKKRTKPFPFIYTVAQRHRWSIHAIQSVSNSSNLLSWIKFIVWSKLCEQSSQLLYDTHTIRSICNDGFQKSFATTIPWNCNQQSKQLYHKRTEISMPVWHSGSRSRRYFVWL